MNVVAVRIGIPVVVAPGAHIKTDWCRAAGGLVAVVSPPEWIVDHASVGGATAR